jgi:hypothetical protein
MFIDYFFQRSLVVLEPRGIVELWVPGEGKGEKVEDGG